MDQATRNTILQRSVFFDMFTRMKNPKVMLAKRYFELSEFMNRDNFQYQLSRREPIDEEADHANLMKVEECEFPEDGLGVYAVVVRHYDAYFVKIGWTKSMRTRWSTLKSNELRGRPMQLGRFVFTEYAVEIEACMKKRFQERKVEGEVFQITLEEWDNMFRACSKGALESDSQAAQHQ
jgi:T5orf172 domain